MNWKLAREKQKKYLERHDEAEWRNNNCEENNDSKNEKWVDLPSELVGVSNQVYESQDDLERDLTNHGYTDLFVALHPKTRKPRLRITLGAHDMMNWDLERD